jgi:predicted aspartyl protease
MRLNKVLSISQDTDSEEAQPAVLQLSMHALINKKPSKHTFTLSIVISNHKATTLVDTGSTTTFMTPSFATTTQCSMIPTPKMKLSVANGDILWT